MHRILSWIMACQNRNCLPVHSG